MTDTVEKVWVEAMRQHPLEKTSEFSKLVQKIPKYLCSQNVFLTWMCSRGYSGFFRRNRPQADRTQNVRSKPRMLNREAMAKVL